ncbi:hypothetical protein SAMN05428976_103234 [Clostridium sp. USBA 49]|uniref:hypothetical protein n=1 Tax=Clostridium TaxID=1485 RepID=UPI0009997632|nr:MULTISPECIES: hypothetical protein [Clostridium]SKA79151.1 hypothetical protein SAMN05428976_103234 [Clostridium sp. USBA 49]
MENALNNNSLFYKTMEEYENDIDSAIEDMISKNERIVFALVAEKSGVTNFVVRRYPELRNYILKQIKYYKEIQVINKKIDKACKSLIKQGKSLTFISIINKCKFPIDMAYNNLYIKDKIRSVLINNRL